MSGKQTSNSLEKKLKEEARELRGQVEELREAIDNLTTEKTELEQSNKYLTELLNNERDASHLLRQDAQTEKKRREFAENRAYSLESQLSNYANQQGGREAVTRFFPNRQIDRMGNIA